MKERLQGLFRFLWRWLSALARWLWHLLVTFVAWVGRSLRLFGTGQSIRAKERERTRLLAGMGEMVYALYKRNMVGNHDLLAECEKVRDLDLSIDKLLDKGDLIRTERRPTAAPQPEVAHQRVETSDVPRAATSLDAADASAASDTVSVESI